MLGGISDKEPACQCRRCKRQRFESCIKKIPWRRAWQPTPVFVPENPMERGVWRATVCRVTKSWIWLKWFNTHTHSPWSMLYVCYYYYISMIPFCFYVAVYLCAFLMSEISFLFGLQGISKPVFPLFSEWGERERERESLCVCVYPQSICRTSKCFFINLSTPKVSTILHLHCNNTKYHIIPVESVQIWIPSTKSSLNLES